MSAGTFTRLTLTDRADGTEEQLLELAAEADHGFDRLLFADALGALTQITDAAFAEYRADPDMIADMRHRFAELRRELLAAALN